MKTSNLEAQFDHYWKMLGTKDAPVPEFQFLVKRRFRFDRAWVSQKVAVELEGGTWSRGRHTRGSGFERDCHKYNIAALAGWRVLRFTSTMLKQDPAGCVEQVKEALK